MLSTILCEKICETHIDHALVDVDIQVASLVAGAAKQGWEEEQEA